MINLTYRLALPLLLVTMIIHTGCQQQGDTTLVTGKTVMTGMGVEKVEVSARKEKGETIKTLSGYHGSFRLRLEPGKWTITGRAMMPTVDAATGEDMDYGVVGSATVETKPGMKRLDRVVVEMSPTTNR